MRSGRCSRCKEILTLENAYPSIVTAAVGRCASCSKHYHVTKEKVPRKVQIKACAICKTNFTDTTWNQQRKFCSTVCCSRSSSDRSGVGLFTIKSCKQCGAKIETRYRKKVYCSLKCGNLASYKRIGRRNTPKQIQNKEFVYADKLAKGCSRCPERRPSCLQYHHLDPALKIAGIGTLTQHACVEIIAKEMKKCIILCANCHFVEEHGDGYNLKDRPNV